MYSQFPRCNSNNNLRKTLGVVLMLLTLGGADIRVTDVVKLVDSLCVIMDNTL